MHVFSKGISTKWNSKSLVQDLNSKHRFLVNYDNRYAKRAFFSIVMLITYAYFFLYSYKHVESVNVRTWLFGHLKSLIRIFHFFRNRKISIIMNCLYNGNPTVHSSPSVYIYIYIYIVINRQTVSLYHNSSVWLDTRDASSWDRNPPNFTLDLVCTYKIFTRFSWVWYKARIT